MERLRLNAQQREAVESSDPYVLVSAGPGTGKTHTLLHRIAFMIRRRRVAPDGMVVLTFTRKAAAELRERLSLLLSLQDTASLWVGTIHGRCAWWLRNRGPAEERFSILDRESQAEVVRELREEPDLKGGKAEPTLLLEALSAEKNGVSHPLPLPPSRWERFKQAYARALEAMNALDYDDLLLKTLEHLEKEPGSGRDWHVLVDEFQDINELQHRIIQHWVGRQGTLFAIGDGDQAIYGFRGASLDPFLNFEQEYPGGRVYRLTRNYRSPEVIVGAAGNVIQCNRRRHRFELTARTSQRIPIRCVELEDERAEAAFVAREIARILGVQRSTSLRFEETEEEGHLDFGDVAVLFRIHRLAAPLRRALEQQGLPLKEAARDPVLEDDTCRAALALLRFLVNPRDDSALAHWLRVRGGKKGSSRLVEWKQRARREGVALWEMLERVSEESQGSDRQAAAWKEEVEHLRDLFAGTPLETVLADAGALLDAGEDPRDPAHPWSRLMHQAASLGSGRVAAETAAELLDRHVLANPSEHFDERARAVSLLTLHAAKGLEFPVVFLVGAEDGLLPYREGRRDTDLEEERRLFYVGITRTAERLVVTYCRNRRLWGERLSRRPSPFIEEMGDRFLRKERLRVEKKKSRDRQLTLWGEPGP